MLSPPFSPLCCAVCLMSANAYPSSRVVIVAPDSLLLILLLSWWRRRRRCAPTVPTVPGPVSQCRADGGEVHRSRLHNDRNPRAWSAARWHWRWFPVLPERHIEARVGGCVVLATPHHAYHTTPHHTTLCAHLVYSAPGVLSTSSCVMRLLISLLLLSLFLLMSLSLSLSLLLMMMLRSWARRVVCAAQRTSCS
jgi:hypothetical protein